VVFKLGRDPVGSPTVTRKKWKTVNKFVQSWKWQYWRSKRTVNK